MYYQNIVIGKPLVSPVELLARDEVDWLHTEEKQTMFIGERWLPAVLKAAGVVGSTSEIKRNRPELMIKLTYPDCFWVSWGKKKIYIVVGE